MAINNSKINIKLNLQAKNTKSDTKKIYKDFTLIEKSSKQASAGINSMTKSLNLLSITAKVFAGIKVAKFFGGFVNNSMDAIESVNLFNVAMGDLAEETNKTVESLHNLSGLDTVSIMNNIGGYNLLARSMGVVSEKAQTLSVTSNNLAQDLASLTNRSFKDVSDDLRSGLVGQSETMYKYGVDMTEASLKQEALNQGISKSVRNMSQAEKMQLRYAVMLKQTAITHGDFANTINEPANQLRILQERLLTLSRSIGSIFIPALEAVLPLLNALSMLATEVADKIATAFGYIPPEVKGVSNGFSEVGDEVDSTGESVDDLKEKISQLAGFDQLNILGRPETTSTTNTADTTATTATAGNGPVDIDVGSYNNKIDGIAQKSTEIIKKIKQGLKEAFSNIDLRGFNASFVKLKQSLSRIFKGFGGLGKDAYNKLVKPFIKNLLTDFIPKTNNIISRTFDNLDFDKMSQALNKLYEALMPVGDFVSDSLLTFMDVILRPLTEWVFNDAIPTFFNGISTILNSINWDVITEKLRELMEALKGLGKPIGDGLKSFYENVIVPFGSYVGNEFAPRFFEIVTGAIKGLTDFLEKNKSTIDDFMKDVLGPLAEFTADAFLDVLEKVLEALGKFAQWVIDNPDKFKTITTVLIGLFAAVQVFKGMSFIGALFAEGGALAVGLSVVTKLFSGFGKVLLFLLKPIASLFGWLLEASGVSAFFAGLGEVLAVGFASIGTYLLGVLSAVGGVIMSALSAIGTAILAVLGAIATFLGIPIWAVVAIIAAVVAAIIAVIYVLYNYGDEIAAWFKQKWSEIGEWFKQTWSNFSSWLEPIIKNIGDTLSEVWNNVKTTFKQAFVNIGEFVAEKFTAVAEFLRGIFSNIGSVLYDSFKTAINMAIGLFNFFIDFVNNVLDFSWPAINIGGKEIISGGHVTLAKIPNIPQLAKGGILSAGQPFIAGEAGKELIGSYNNKTTVMPLENTSFVQAIKDAVKQGVQEASGNDQSIVVNVGGDTLLDEVISGANRKTRQTGKFVFEV